MKETVARDVMNAQVLTVRPEMTVRDLAAFLTENQISGAPVVDSHGCLVGVVSLTDIAESDSDRNDRAPDRSKPELFVRGWEDGIRPEEVQRLRLEQADLLVRDIMTPTAYTVPEDTPVGTVAQTMVAGRIHRLLVTRGHKLIGIVTSLDLLKLLFEHEGTAPSPRARRPRRAAERR